nr:venom protein [Lampona murina]
MFCKNKETLLFLLVGMLLLTHEVISYVYRGMTDTSDGFCDVEHFGRIAVGNDGYNDDRCERVTCQEGGYVGVGCGSVSIDGGSPYCKLVKRQGQYPICCPTISCDNFTTENNLY